MSRGRHSQESHSSQKLIPFTCVSPLTCCRLLPLPHEWNGHVSFPGTYSDPPPRLDQTTPRRCGGPCRHLHIRRPDNDPCARGLRCLSRLHDSGSWLGTRLGHVPVRRVRGRSEGPDVATDPRLLLPRHPAEHYVRRNQDQSRDQCRQRQQSASTARDWPHGPRHRRAPLHSAHRGRSTPRGESAAPAPATGSATGQAAELT
jgi:hypothetical protein